MNAPAEQVTDIIMIVDQSSSMTSIHRETMEGYNTFLREQKAAPGKATITLLYFGSVPNYAYKAVDIQDAPLMSTSNYHPAGGTALLDAIGKGILDTGERQNNLLASERPSRTLVVILTDGEENQSQTWKLPEIKSLLRMQEERYGWDIVFLGATEDAIKVGEGLGVTPGKAAKFSATPEQTKSVFESISKTTSSYRSGAMGAAGASVDSFFTDADRKKIDNK